MRVELRAVKVKQNSLNKKIMHQLLSFLLNEFCMTLTACNSTLIGTTVANLLPADRQFYQLSFAWLISQIGPTATHLCPL